MSLEEKIGTTGRPGVAKRATSNTSKKSSRSAQSRTSSNTSFDGFSIQSITEESANDIGSRDGVGVNESPNSVISARVVLKGTFHETESSPVASTMKMTEKPFDTKQQKPIHSMKVVWNLLQRRRSSCRIIHLRTAERSLPLRHAGANIRRTIPSLTIKVVSNPKGGMESSLSSKRREYGPRIIV